MLVWGGFVCLFVGLFVVVFFGGGGLETYFICKDQYLFSCSDHFLLWRGMDNNARYKCIIIIIIIIFLRQKN